MAEEEAYEEICEKGDKGWGVACVPVFFWHWEKVQTCI